MDTIKNVKNAGKIYKGIFYIILYTILHISNNNQLNIKMQPQKGNSFSCGQNSFLTQSLEISPSSVWGICWGKWGAMNQTWTGRVQRKLLNCYSASNTALISFIYNDLL